MSAKIRRRKFKNIDLSDTFFDSLKADYDEFEEWFSKKAEASAYVIESDSKMIEAFLHVKLEEGTTTDIKPPVKAARIAKIATFKANAHGTKRGEYLLRKAIDVARNLKADKAYVTVFDKYRNLIELFLRYGFKHFGTKSTINGTEQVYVRAFPGKASGPFDAFPYIRTKGRTKYLLAIYPEFHSGLFPDSPLADGTYGDHDDVSHANTILKAYVSGLTLSRMKAGDIVVVYRTKDRNPARTRSAATTICVVTETQTRSDWPSESIFLKKVKPHSVFKKDELRARFASGARLQVVFMTYNAVLPNPVSRGNLLDKVGISEYPRWDIRKLTDSQFSKIVKLGKMDEDLIVD